jgi:putative endonuclease
LSAKGNTGIMSKTYHVYIVASLTRVIYIGVTSDLIRRIYEHKTSPVAGFTKSYNVNRLVYFEETIDVHSAIAREKELKGWRRSKKVALIESQNPKWLDLYLQFTA